MTVCTYDERRDIAIAGNPEEAVYHAAEKWMQAAARAIKDHQVLPTAALSGGSTPKAIYRLLKEKKEALDWSKVRLHFSDERCVPLDSSESNYHMAWEAGFKHLIDPSQIFPVLGAADNPERAALDYAAILPAFDLIMLGMGEDGHVASLFPHTCSTSRRQISCC